MDKIFPWNRINKRTLLFPGILLIITITIAFIIPTQFAAAMNAGKAWVLTHFGWFFALAVTAIVVILLWMAFSKAGNIRFGGKDCQPDLSFWKWFCIVVTAGMAAGCCYYGVAEPLDFFINFPGFGGAEPGSPQAAELTLRYVFMHWGLHPYAAYTIPSIAIGFMYWNGKRKYAIASGLYPLLGEKVDGPVSDWVNAICIFGYVSGFSCAVGLSTDQIATGINYVFNINLNKDILYILIVSVFVIVSVAAASSGLHKAIATISTMNMYLYIVLVLAALLFSRNLIFILNNTVTSVGQFFQFLPGQSLYLEPGQQTGWVSGWTIFYWAWWVVVCPMVGLFQVKMAKGRTLRQFILVNMLAPLLFTIVWFGFFGSSVIGMILKGNTAIVDAYNTSGASIAWFAWAKELPLGTLWGALGILAILFSVVTMLEAQLLNCSDLSTSGVELDDASGDATRRSPLGLKIFWGLVIVGIGYALLYSDGGLGAVQTLAIIVGLPIMVFTCVLTFCGIKVVTNYKKYDKTLAPGEDYER